MATPKGAPEAVETSPRNCSNNCWNRKPNTCSARPIDLAKEGNLAALRLCMDRLLPVRRDRCVSLEISTEDIADPAKAFPAILTAIADGTLTPAEGESLSNIVRSQAQTQELLEFDRRLKALETRNAEKECEKQRKEADIPPIW